MLCENCTQDQATWGNYCKSCYDYIKHNYKTCGMCKYYILPPPFPFCELYPKVPTKGSILAAQKCSEYKGGNSIEYDTVEEAEAAMLQFFREAVKEWHERCEEGG